MSQQLPVRQPQKGEATEVTPSEIAAEVLSYYEFLVGMYLPGSAIKRAPERGWPEITASTIKSPHKTGEVVNILKHLPYLSHTSQREEGDSDDEDDDDEDQDDEGEEDKDDEKGAAAARDEDSNPVAIYHQSYAIDYSNRRQPQSIPLEGQSHELLLSQRASPDGVDILINAQTGQVTKRSDQTQETFDSIQDFCNATRQELLELKLIPYSVSYIQRSDDSEEKAYASRIYQDHGWSTEAYQRAEVVKALRILNKKIARRNELAARLKSFYQLLVRLYLPDAALIEPGPEGWPNINSNTLEVLQREYWVIDLLKHIPYIRWTNEEGEEPNHILPECFCVDYSGEFIQHCLEIGDQYYTTVMQDELPASVAVLGNMSDRNGNVVVYDTETDEIAFWTPLDSFEPPYESLSSFFDPITEAFLSLDYVVRSPRHIDQRLDEGVDEKQDELVLIYQNNGWPGDAFKKDRCAAERVNLDESME